jgi:hypothetical protein
MIVPLSHEEDLTSDYVHHSYSNSFSLSQDTSKLREGEKALNH